MSLSKTELHGTGVLYISEGIILFTGNATISNNIGSLTLFSGEFNTTQMGNIKVLIILPLIRPPAINKEVQSLPFKVGFSYIMVRTCILMQNEAENGGAIYVTESKWFNCMFVANNTATDWGRGLSLSE